MLTVIFVSHTLAVPKIQCSQLFPSQHTSLAQQQALASTDVKGQISSAAQIPLSWGEKAETRSNTKCRQRSSTKRSGCFSRSRRPYRVSMRGDQHFSETPGKWKLKRAPDHTHNETRTGPIPKAHSD